MHFPPRPSADDADNTEPDESADDPPQISRHAIAGVRTSETMLVHLKLNGIVLLDSSSSNNFPVKEAAGHNEASPHKRRLKCDTKSVPGG